VLDRKSRGPQNKYGRDGEKNCAFADIRTMVVWLEGCQLKERGKEAKGKKSTERKGKTWRNELRNKYRKGKQKSDKICQYCEWETPMTLSTQMNVAGKRQNRGPKNADCNNCL